jgi:Spy/CpxP family protein refolding chaperone
VRQRARAVGALLLAATFAVGGLAGMAAEEALGLDWFDFLDEDAAPAEDRLFAGVELTGAQERQIEGIRDRREERLEGYWESRLPDIQRIMDDSYGEMRRVLTPEQQPAFDRRVREMRGRISADPD